MVVQEFSRVTTDSGKNTQADTNGAIIRQPSVRLVNLMSNTILPEAHPRILQAGFAGGVAQVHDGW